MNKTLLKLKVSLVSAGKVLRKPQYALLAVFGAILTSGFILWSLNLGLLIAVLFKTSLGVSTKVGFFMSVYSSLYTIYGTFISSVIIIFAVLFGINLSLLMFTLKHHGFTAIPQKSSASGFMLAVIAGGCAACGTSLVAPLLTTFGATSTVFIQDISILFLLLGSVLITYSVYKLGLVCAYVLAREPKP